MSIRVSIDASGGDFGFSVTINAGISALKTYDDLLINFVGDEAGIKNELNKNSSYSNFADRIDVTHASEVINMSDSPSVALRHKKDSSMRVAINLVKNGEADAVLADNAYLAPIADEDGDLQLLDQKELIGGGVGMGLRESDGELKGKFDAAIQSMKDDGTLNVLIAKWEVGEQF